MAKTSVMTIPVGLDTTYYKAIQSGDRFTIPHVKVKRLFTSRSRKKGLTQKSLMVLLAPVWAGFSQEIKDNWSNAGSFCDMSGWRLFIQDTALRIANDLAGYSTPEYTHQGKVGKIGIESPAVGLTILQLHPQTYYVSKKVVGTRSQYEPKLITENLSLPVAIAISYRAELVATGSNPYAKFYIIIYCNYQGITLESVCEIPFYLSHDWISLRTNISSVKGQFRGYTAFIETHDCQGNIYFDNVEIDHGGINWARDPFCNSIQTTFTKMFYQIPKNWAPQEIISGAFYRSVFEDFIPIVTDYLLTEVSDIITTQDNIPLSY